MGGAVGSAGRQVQHVVLPTWIDEEPGEVADALAFAHADGAPVEDHVLEVTPPAKHAVAADGRLLAVHIAILARSGDCRGSRDPVEDGPGRVPPDGAVLIPGGGQCLGECQAGECRLVRSADPVPEPHRLGKGLVRTGRVALGEAHRPRASAASATSAVVAKRVEVRCSSSAAERARSRSPAGAAALSRVTWRSALPSANGGAPVAARTSVAEPAWSACQCVGG